MTSSGIIALAAALAIAISTIAPALSQGRTAAKAMEAGAWAVVAGTGITHPTSITSWFKAAIEG